MEQYTPDFTVAVQGVKGLCPAGEKYAKEQMATNTIPVLTCEGPCIRGEIARLAGNLISQEVPSLARACHAEAFFVPRSSMATWVKRADKTIMIDGCFLKCHGRILKKLIPAEKVIHIDALPLYKRYTDLFSIDDVPEAERKSIARQVADKIISQLQRAGHIRQVVLLALLVWTACAGPAARRTAIGQPAPCADSTYVQLKRQNPDSLSERAWQRLQSLDRDCATARAVSQQPANDATSHPHNPWHWMGIGTAIVVMAVMMWGAR